MAANDIQTRVQTNENRGFEFHCKNKKCLVIDDLLRHLQVTKLVQWLVVRLTNRKTSSFSIYNPKNAVICDSFSGCLSERLA